MHWYVLEIIERETAAARLASTERYILLVQGQFAYLPGEGEEYITPAGARAGGG